MFENEQGLELLADRARLSKENRKLRTEVSRLELRVAALDIDVTNLEDINLRLKTQLAKIEEVVNAKD